LPVDNVKRIKRDSHGFLWFCTRDGLSKFDGYQFTNYGKEQGLPHPNVNDLIESSAGSYWVATNGAGVSSFNPTERVPFNNASNNPSRFKVYSLDSDTASNRVNRLCEDREGRIWAGTDSGLFYFDTTQDRFIRAITDEVEINSLLVDRQGVLWMGAGNRLWRRTTDGSVARYSFQAARDLGRIFSLVEDNEGKLWVGTLYAGLFRIDVQLLPQKDSMLRAGKTKGSLDQYTTVQGAVIGAVEDLHQSADGHLWIAASPDFTKGLGGGLFEFYGQKFRRYGKAQGLRSDHIKCLADDGQTNLWLGSIDGAMKIASNGFTTFDRSDGLLSGTAAIFENRRGELCTITERGMVLNRFEDGRFSSIRFNVPAALENKRLWGNYQITFQDHQGDWWVPTSKGLMRFADVERLEQLARARPKAHYLLEGDRELFDIFRLFEDSRGDIWVSLASGAKNGLVKWERATEKFRYYTEADGVPPLNPPSSFCEDDKGNLWIGLYDGGLLRYRQGRFTLFGKEDGLPSGLIYHLYLDRSRRLWIASSSDGAGRIDDTEADPPQFARLTVADGLSSNVVYSVTEDNFGGIYFRTTRGVDRLNPVIGNIKRYTAADGLPAGDGLAFRDRQGAIWFSAFYGVTRLMPSPDEPQPPPIFITGLRINGEARAIADLGEARMGGLTLNPGENHLQIDFVGLAFGTGEALRYQYRLEGADADWQALTSLRAVNYANLAPGAYRFVVRAMNAEGNFSPTAASVEFTILSPIWQRWWFISIIGTLAALIVYALYRYRIARFLEIERVRTRIASDLHDDIGANLTKIAILTEVAQQQFGVEDTDGGPLSSAARISRESLDSMGDIVWAINPKRDSLRELARRMRGFATDIFTSRNIEFSFHAVDQDLDLKLGPDIRRDVFLIFKEAVNNAVRHSECSQAAIELKIEAPSLVLIVRDDGKGFDATTAGEGNGLVSMTRRAESMDGTLDICSNVGKGTSVTLTAPIGHHHLTIAKAN
jgi:signal transduction histidine kinase/ligand-binding sensor domain-containing protein